MPLTDRRLSEAAARQPGDGGAPAALCYEGALGPAHENELIGWAIGTNVIRSAEIMAILGAAAIVVAVKHRLGGGNRH